jgi:hypothetical protein
VYKNKKENRRMSVNECGVYKYKKKRKQENESIFAFVKQQKNVCAYFAQCISKKNKKRVMCMLVMSPGKYIVYNYTVFVA